MGGCSVWAKPNSLVCKIGQSSFSRQNRTEKDRELRLEVVIDLPPLLSLSTQKRWGGLQEASLVVIFIFSAFFTFIVNSVSQRRGIKWRRIR
jgi:hypothetical protein